MNWIILVLAAGIFALIIERGLHYSPLSPRWRYRLAFLAGLGLGLLGFYIARSVPWAGGSPSPSPWLARLGSFLGGLIAAALGAFLGGLSATAINEGLWEDNAPPPRPVRVEVMEIHRRVFSAAAAETPALDPASKRIFDLLLSSLGLLISAPVWIFSLFIVWFEDPGPVLFVKNSVGRDGLNFHQFKIRSMVLEAERSTGPVLAVEGDERILWIGRFLRKTALDELPQLLNILRGEMSFVGPRPQRTILVHTYLQNMPEYAWRHRVRPGLAGLAQVAGDYYLTPRQKLRFDRVYIEHIGLGFDLKLLTLAFLITFWYRWQKRWNGRLPRRLLHGG